MLDAIARFFRTSMNPPEETGESGESGAAAPDLELAACALLLELAHADDAFSDEERQHVEAAVRRHFDVDPARAEELLELAEAERREAVDFWQFTSLIDRNYSLAQKTLLAEVMWGLMYSDGELADKEQYLMRKISNLLHIKPGYLSEAKKRVEARQTRTEFD
ncbi:MAG: TerB family tellurite resistance protein [Gemmatimonadota bacterium]